MLIGFLGCPCSGKTTAAAIVYARLKRDGVTAELIPEQARNLIAQKRCLRKLLPHQPLALSDSDQVEIMQRQRELEVIFTTACGENVVVISDGCVYNTLLYLDGKSVCDNQVKEILANPLKYHTIFYCPPIPFSSQLDPNRVHDEQESKQLDKKISEIQRLIPLQTRVVALKGTPERRASLVLNYLYEQKFSFMSE